MLESLSCVRRSSTVGGSNKKKVSEPQVSNPSIERTCSGRRRLPSHAAHVER
jgi:hypothetical protein